MILNKRGISQTVGVILLIMIVIVSVSIIYTITNYFTKQAVENNQIKITTTDLELAKSLLILEKTTGKLQINIKRNALIKNVTIIKAVVLGTSDSGSYLIYDVPKTGDPKTYVLNVSMIGNIREILIYPVSYLATGSRTQSEVLTSSGQHINELMITPEPGQERTEYFTSNDLTLTTAVIDSNAPFLNPETNRVERADCISKWVCEEWTTCHAIYTLDNVISNDMLLNGEQTRLCIDKNYCISYLVDRRECDNKEYIRIVKTEVGNTQYIEIFNSQNKSLSKLEFIKGEHNVLNIDIPII